MSFKDHHDAMFDLDTEHNAQAIRVVAMCTYYFNLTLLIIAMFVALVYMFVDGGEFIWISLIILGSCLVEYLGVTAITTLIMGKAASLNELHNIKRILDASNKRESKQYLKQEKHSQNITQLQILKETGNKKENDIIKKLEYALQFQTDEGMISYLKKIYDTNLKSILDNPPNVIRKQIKELLEDDYQQYHDTICPNCEEQLSFRKLDVDEHSNVVCPYCEKKFKFDFK